MRFLRSKRGLAGVGALAAVVGVTLFVVLPTFAATSSGFAGATTTVTPTYLASGGQNDCDLFKAQSSGTAVGSDQYFASNPKAISGKTQTLTALNGATVKLTVTVDKTYTFLGFDVSGAVVTDVGIKGGNGTDWYNYETQPGGGVTGDQGLTAPAQTIAGKAPFYGLSQTVFCYTPTGSVSGTVYQDLTSPANGSFDSGTDTPLAGWKVTVYDGVDAVSSATSGANGAYTVPVVFDTSATYSVCEAPPGAGAWSQTQPLPSSSDVCTGVGAGSFQAELPKGYTLQPTSSTQAFTSKNFGNVTGGQTCTDTAFGITGYNIQLANCETAKQHNQFFFNSGTISGVPFVSVWSGGPDTTSTPMVEKITFDDSLTSGQPAFTGLKYDDSFPFTGPYNAMPYCTGDPRATGSEFTLADPTTSDGALPSGATSCLISTSITATSSSKATFVAYVYSDIDGLRTAG